MAPPNKWLYQWVTGVITQIITTSHDLGPQKVAFSKGIPWLFQGNLGWWDIIIWPDISLDLCLGRVFMDWDPMAFITIKAHHLGDFCFLEDFPFFHPPSKSCKSKRFNDDFAVCIFIYLDLFLRWFFTDWDPMGFINITSHHLIWENCFLEVFPSSWKSRKSKDCNDDIFIMFKITL